MMTANVTKASVLALAKAKRGKRAELRHNPKALDKAAKAELMTQHRIRQQKIEALKNERIAIRKQGDLLESLTKAARFAIDVDGDEPSWTQLREAVERAERHAALGEEMQELEKEGRSYVGLVNSHRWEVTLLVNIGGVLMCECHESADTLEELAAELESK